MFSLSVNGNWGEWSHYDDCDVPCGNGNQQRRRKCDSPRPEQGGSACMNIDNRRLTHTETQSRECYIPCVGKLFCHFC